MTRLAFTESSSALQRIKMVLKTIKTVMRGHENPVLTYTGPCVLTAVCMHPPPHIHVAVGVDQLLQSVLGRGSARLQSKDSLSV